MSTPSPSRLSRTLGALLGVHAGDSLGATLEFTTWSRIITRYPQGLRDIIGGGPFDWEPGHATDDTDLTRAVLLAYHDREKGKNKAEFDVVKASADYSLKWLNGDWPDRHPGSWPNDIGGATQKGLLNYQLSRNPVTCGAGPGSAGNGSLMRCIPTALFAHEKEQRIKESKAISAFTHNDVRCTISCAVYNEIVAALIQGKTSREAVEIGRAVAKELECRAVEEAIAKGEGMSILQKAAEGPGNELPDHTSGYVLQSLTVAVAALLDQRSLEDVLVDVVRLGGDTDTNGAISGGLLGARDGIEGIPERWLEVLQFRKEFEEVSKSILSSQGLL